MKILHNNAKIKTVIKAWQDEGETVCLVPTMGNIHRGHLALIAKARETANRVVVSIYVNPAQFSIDEDFDSYPRTLKADYAAIIADGGCDAIYAPANMYDAANATSIVPGGVALPMEGELRPHFFTGVTTIVFKLFAHIPADFAIFGEKDFQQLAVIRQMVRDLDMDIRILSHPTIREVDGLALSSRNYYLSALERRLAPKIYSQMQATADLISKGTKVSSALKQGKEQLHNTGFDRIDYFDLRQSGDLKPCDKLEPDSRIFAAIWLGSTRLIDNCAL